MNLTQMTVISTTAGRNPSEEIEWPSWSTKESEGGGNHYCHRGGVCETEGAVESDHTGSAAGGELRGAEDGIRD